MRTLLELHYDEVHTQKYARKVGPRGQGKVLNCVAFAHRKRLNQKLSIPARVKEILRRPQDETDPVKLELLCIATRQEIEAETDVILATDADIEMLAAAVEACDSQPFPDQVCRDVSVGAATIPEGARLRIEVDASRSLAERRRQVVDVVRSLNEGDALRVKRRPFGTSRQPPMDAFARELVSRPYDKLACICADSSPEKTRDRLLLALWAAYKWDGGFECFSF